MDALEVVFVSGVVASILSLLLAFALARRKAPRKDLVWEATSALPIATVLPDRTDYQLSILYQRPNVPPIVMSSAYLYFVRLANLGREPIRRADITPADPLRVEVSGARLLDISLAAVEREVTSLEVGQFRETDALATSSLTFDFLDHRDGALVRVLASEAHARIRVAGTIIGLPEGIRHTGQEQTNRLRTFGMILLAVVLYGAAITATIATFVSYVDDATLLWLLLLPIGVIIVPSLLLLAMTYFTEPHRDWPERIGFPPWMFISILGPHEVYHPPDIPYPDIDDIRGD